MRLALGAAFLYTFPPFSPRWSSQVQEISRSVKRLTGLVRQTSKLKFYEEGSSSKSLKFLCWDPKVVLSRSKGKLEVEFESYQGLVEGK